MARSPWLAAAFLVPALSLAGMPPLSGFWAKLLVVDATLKAEDYGLAAIALFVGVLTLYSMSKIWAEAFWKPAVLPRARPRPVPLPMMVAIGALCVVTLLLGFAPQALVVYSQEAARQLLDPALYIGASLAPAGSMP